MNRFPDWRIIGCPKCHTLQIVRSDRKTRRCPKCGYTIKLLWSKLRIWYRTDDVKEAMYALQQLKLKGKKKVRSDVPNLNIMLIHSGDGVSP